MPAAWDSIYALSESLGNVLSQIQAQLASAESCTGGGIGYAITQTPGSSEWYAGGINAYSNEVKQNLLGVDSLIIQEQGAVNERVVAQMAAGAARNLDTQVALATSGIAGPGGGSENKPIGTVCFAWQIFDQNLTETKLFSGDREAVRLKSIEYSLRRLIELL